VSVTLIDARSSHGGQLIGLLAWGRKASTWGPEKTAQTEQPCQSDYGELWRCILPLVNPEWESQFSSRRRIDDATLQSMSIS